MQVLSKMNNLEVLELDRNKITGIGMAKIAQAISNVKVLTLSIYHSIH